MQDAGAAGGNAVLCGVDKSPYVRIYTRCTSSGTTYITVYIIYIIYTIQNIINIYHANIT